MIGASIAGYEIRRLLRDRALPALLLLLLGLGAYAAWNGSDWVRQRQAAIALIEAEEQQMAARARGFVGNTPMVVLPRAQPVLPPGPMAPLSIGQSDAYPFTADVVALGDYSQLFGRLWPDIGNPAVRAAGRFDLAFVVVFLLPLALLAGTYDLWTRERERGIAVLVLSQSVTIGALIAAKTLARGAILLLPSTAALLALAVWAGARDVGGLAALGLAILAYGGFWLAVAALINVFARRSTEAAIAAGVIWLATVVMAPALALAAIDLAAPPPSEMRLATDMKARMAQIAERQRLQRALHPVVERTPAPRISDRMRVDYADRVAADRELEPMIASHEAAKRARRELLDKARWVLPSVAMQDALDRIAGSDADRALAFQGQVVGFWQQRRLLHKSYLDRDATQTLAEYDRLPGFRFRDDAGPFQPGVLADLAALVAAASLALAIAWTWRRRAAKP